MSEPLCMCGEPLSRHHVNMDPSHSFVECREPEEPPRIVTAEEARKLLEGATQGPMVAAVDRHGIPVVNHATAGVDVPIAVLEVSDGIGTARLFAASVDLAHTVLTLTAERDEARRERDAARQELSAAAMDASIGAAVIAVLRGEPVSDFEESFGPVMEAQNVRHLADCATAYAADLAALRAPKPNTATWHTRTVGPYKGWTELRRASGRLVGRYIRRTPESERVEVIAAGNWYTAPGEESARQSILNWLPKGVEVVGG